MHTDSIFKKGSFKNVRQVYRWNRWLIRVKIWETGADGYDNLSHCVMITTECPEGCESCEQDGSAAKCTKCYDVKFGQQEDDNGVITCIG